LEAKRTAVSPPFFIDYNERNPREPIVPLRDHFHPPLANQRSWRGFLSGWTFLVTKQLNDTQLTHAYEAVPETHVGSQNETNATIASDNDAYEVRVYETAGARKLVAAIELISPANKDRPSTRRAFTTKVASYLQSGISLVVVDFATSHPANLHAELGGLLHLPDQLDWQSSTGLSAIAYRPVRESYDVRVGRLELWTRPLTLGEPLATPPLWLSPTRALPLELETTYEHTCWSLRIG
jgi:hypothetical protein